MVLKFRGREMAHQNLGREVMNKIIVKMADIAKAERDVKMEGRQMVMVISRIAKAAVPTASESETIKK